jgi:Ca2+-binding RTX toxin-like protein
LTVSDFEVGHSISGISVYGGDLDTIINGASSATLTSTATNSFSGSYTTANGLGIDPNGTVNVTYYLEELAFMSGGSVDLTAPITFTGSSSADTLTGLDGRADTIYGMDGNDTISGYGGNDTIVGGSESDNLNGGTGDDAYVVAAGWGSDTINESLSSGTDTIHFTGIDPSDIRIYTDASNGKLHLASISDPTNTIAVTAGVTGNNTWESTAGLYVEQVTFDDANNTVWDLTGALTITGSSAAESLYGTAYNDTISGLGGNDTIYGNAGNDTIIGGAGADNLNGGPGNDTYVVAAGWGSDTINESLSSGTDTIHFTGIDPSDIRIYTDASNGKLHLTSISDPTNTIAVTAAVTGNNTWESTAGLYVEQVTFDDANNTVWDLTGGLTITGTSGAESLYGTAYNDTINGLGGNDTIYGNAGNDTITGGAGADALNGGPGNDTYVVAAGWGSDTINESLSSGTDTIHFTGIDPSDIRIYTDASNGKLHLTSISDPTNTIAVTAAVTGNNTWESTAGLYVEQVTFDDANNTVWDLTGALTITGTSGAESLYGTAYNDTISGLGGNDTIYGNAGNDTITGGAGTDSLTGGPGDDTYVVAAGWGSDTITETSSGGADTIHFTGIDPSDIRIYTDASNGTLHLTSISDSTNTIAVTAGITGNNTYESTAGQRVEQVTFDDANNTVWDLTGGLNITGTSSGQSLYGTAYNDTINGMGGADTLYGNAGDDALYGGSGNDGLHGGPGNDVLQGNGGTDNLYGDAGADTFMFKAASAFSASVNIQDFSTSAGDKIDIKDVISGYDPATMAITDWVQITTSGSNSILKVDTDGTGSGHTWQQIATIVGVTGLTDEAALVASGNLVVHA